MNYKILTLVTLGNESFDAWTDLEEDAEEVGAALALAGYDVRVYYGDKLIHEFFAS